MAEGSRMWAISLLTIMLLTLLSAAPIDFAGDAKKEDVKDDNDGMHSHDENVTRQGKFFGHNQFDVGNINVPGSVAGDVVSIGHEVKIDVHGHTHDHHHHEADTVIECKEGLPELFKSIDSNMNGLMDVKELLRVCHQKNIQITESLAVRILTLPDKTVGFNMATFCDLLKDCPSTNSADVIYFLLQPYDKGIVDGGWSAWSSWSDCTGTCGEETRTRTLACSSPAGGAATEAESCGLPSCEDLGVEFSVQQGDSRTEHPFGMAGLHPRVISMNMTPLEIVAAFGMILIVYHFTPLSSPNCTRNFFSKFPDLSKFPCKIRKFGDQEIWKYQTEAAAKALIEANKSPARKKIEKEEFYSPPRRRREVSSSPSPVKESSQDFSSLFGRSSPVLVRKDVSEIDKFRNSLSEKARSLMKDQSMVQRSMAEEEARDKLNRMNMQKMFESSDRPRHGEEVLPPVSAPQMIFPKGLSSEHFMKFVLEAAKKLNDQSGSNEQNISVPPSSKKKKAVVKLEVESEEDGEIGDDEEEEEEQSGPGVWSGLHHEFKNDSVVVSSMAQEFWESATSTDAKSRKTCAFKKAFKKASKYKFYTEGDDLSGFRPPQRNPELPKLEGFRLKEEEDFVAIQKGIGAAASAECASVDALRSLKIDLLASAQDFSEGAFQDPGQEAENICLTVANMIEEAAIANSVQSIRFLGGAFAFTSFKRHMLALRQVTAEDAKKVLADSPPDREWLFGAEIKTSVQRIRDSSLITRAFHARGNLGRGGYRNHGGRGGRGRNSYDYVPRKDRFRGSFRGRYKKYNKRGGYDGNYGAYGNRNAKDKSGGDKKDKDE